MHTINNHSYELGAIRLTLRRDLTVRPERSGETGCYQIEDVANSKFFRVGTPEYTFLSLLDGKTSIANAVAETATKLGRDAFTETQAAAFCRWLVDNSLASTKQSASVNRLQEHAERDASRKKREWLNPLMLKIPLGRPQALLRSLSGGMSWCFSSVGAGLWLAVVLLGAYRLWMNFEHFGRSVSSLVAADNWVWLGLTALLLKVIHEAAHGLACDRFGGDTREAGILLLLFVPLPYVDVTSAWRFGSKWQRVIVSAAGMYAEFFIAAVAAIIWTSTNSAIIQFHACNVIVTAGFVTLLFNMNPLMRFDGYYILTDAFDLPNLATHGQQDIMSLARRWLLGLKEQPPEWPDGRRLIVRMYGLASLVWKMLILVSLTLAAAALYHGAGIVLAAVALCLWILLPAFNFVKYIILSDPINPPNRLRFSLITTSMAALTFGGWNYVPYVERIQLAATVDYAPIITVRAATSGFVRKIHVRPGDSVTAGQSLFTLENVELTARIQQLQLAAETSRLDATKYHREGKLAAFQIEQENAAAVQKRINELQAQADSLTVRATDNGTVVSRRLSDFADRWVTAGTELMLLGNDQQRSVRFVVAQSDIASVRTALHQPAHVHIWGSADNDLTGVIAEIEPRGSTALRYPSLAVTAGGPLAVKQVPSGESTDQQWELLEPHFSGRVKLKEGSLNAFGTGQTGVLELTANRGSMGRVLTSWVEGKLRRE